jgi:hypothetical protein
VRQARHDRRRSLQPVELILGQRLLLARPAKLGHATGERQHRGLEPRVRDRQRWPRGVGVHVGEDVVEGGEPHGELGALGVEDGILGVDGKEALRGEAERGGDWRVLAAQMRSLRGEVVQVALLAHPRAACGWGASAWCDAAPPCPWRRRGQRSPRRVSLSCRSRSRMPLVLPSVQELPCKNRAE